MASSLKTAPERLPPQALAAPQRRSLGALLWPESGAVNAIPALDGLRAVAVLLVILFHAWTFVPGHVLSGQNEADYPIFYGKTGVQLFFVLSGFLLFLPYAQWAFGLRERPATLLFYKRRALRVGPAYWASLAVLALTLPKTLATVKDLALHVGFLSNTTWETTFSINGVYWTMAIEVQFYALLPAIGWLIYRLARASRPLVAGTLVFLLLGSISFLCHALASTGQFDTVPVVSSAILAYSAMPYWLGVFACGIVGSLFYTYVTKVARLRKAQMERLRGLCSLAFFVGVALALALAFIPLLHQVLALDLLFGIAYAGLLLGVVLGGKILRWPFASRPMRFAGLISYSFYIWHRVVLHALEPHLRYGSLRLQVVILFAVGVLASTLVSYCSYQLLERPFINARKKSHEGQKPRAVIAQVAVEPGWQTDVFLQDQRGESRPDTPARPLRR
jgi:peptidoglycan/LPS O-acetylase OafA/YrhL